MQKRAGVVSAARRPPCSDSPRPSWGSPQSSSSTRLSWGPTRSAASTGVRLRQRHRAALAGRGSARHRGQRLLRRRRRGQRQEGAVCAALAWFLVVAAAVMFMHVRRVAECGRDGGLHRGRAAARAQQRRPRLRLRPHRGQGRSLRVGVDRGRRRHRLRDRGLRRRHPAEGPDDHASWASRWGSRSGRRSRHTRLPWLTLRTVATAPSNLQGQRELVGSRLQQKDGHER
ncbi:hypothetical protein PAHAL_9G467400 [Panicum hallii]|uniref:Uncharacterized protein n=1 Tax=Panicum hallii TaxID=206008 RepID=A0A2T8I4W8_9POAL|nr:hypothetical protein PAHAL_9G467400 [Panicum hallii]